MGIAAPRRTNSRTKRAIIQRHRSFRLTFASVARSAPFTIRQVVAVSTANTLPPNKSLKVAPVGRWTRFTHFVHFAHPLAPPLGGIKQPGSFQNYGGEHVGRAVSAVLPATYLGQNCH